MCKLNTHKYVEDFTNSIHENLDTNVNSCSNNVDIIARVDLRTPKFSAVRRCITFTRPCGNTIVGH